MIHRLGNLESGLQRYVYLYICFVHITQERSVNFQIQIESLRKEISDLESVIKDLVRNLDTKIESNFRANECKIAEIAQVLGIKKSQEVLEKIDDRKRLKERLKAGFQFESSSGLRDKNDESWLERVFGIGPPNGKKGKDGSRY